MNKIIGENFHFLSFDPRGINGSIPLASCFVSETQRATKEPNNDGDITLGRAKCILTQKIGLQCAMILWDNTGLI